MDWNKSNTILIIAFILLNIFLLLATFSNTFKDNLNVVLDKDYINSVEELLKNENINIKCEIPQENFILPVLETEYDMVEINNKLVNKYLGKDVNAKEDVFIYNNENNEILEIIDGKMIRNIIREEVIGEIADNELIDKSINKYIKDKDLDQSGFLESYRYISDNGSYILYTQNYNGFNIDNSYMCFFVDKNGVFKFEMQKIDTLMEIKGEIRAISAIEALPRLLTYDDVKNKDIVEIEMIYYSIEDENWKYITGINADPTWKVIFSDGTQKYLSSFDLN